MASEGEARPPLRLLHTPEAFSRSALDFWRSQATDDIIRSLAPNAERPLLVKMDGTIVDGNTRIFILLERDYDVELLPRTGYPR